MMRRTPPKHHVARSERPRMPWVAGPGVMGKRVREMCVGALLFFVKRKDGGVSWERLRSDRHFVFFPRRMLVHWVLA